MIRFTDRINESLDTQKISLDFHGVIDCMPSFFSFLSKAVISSGGEIHILTGSSLSKEFEVKLKSLGVQWTHLFSVYDHLIETGAKTTGEIVFPDGGIQKKFENGLWDHVKADYCKKNNIALHLDDTLIYNDFFCNSFL